VNIHLTWAGIFQFIGQLFCAVLCLWIVVYTVIVVWTFGGVGDWWNGKLRRQEERRKKGDG
jgi:hypothetical protein